MNKLTDYIVKLEGCMSTDLCDRILAEYVGTDEWNEPTINGHYIPEVRNCQLIDMSNHEVIGRNPQVRAELDRAIFESVAAAGAKYKELFPRAVFNCDTGYHLLRYNPGEYIKQHVDTSGQDHRVISCSIQLSSAKDFTGGGWQFFDEDYYHATQDQGDFMMFPSNFCYPHQIQPIESGVRYSIITWLNYQGESR